MAQFGMIPERKHILEKIPDYEVAIARAETPVSVRINGQEVARSDDALLVRETKHADVFYLPRNDVDLSQFRRTDHQTYCPFKGHASYWSTGEQENIVWSYESPYPEVAELQDYLSFYTDRAEVISG